MLFLFEIPIITNTYLLVHQKGITITFFPVYLSGGLLKGGIGISLKMNIGILGK